MPNAHAVCKNDSGTMINFQPLAFPMFGSCIAVRRLSLKMFRPLRITTANLYLIMVHLALL
jgi:hypothetical protein